MDLYHIYSVTKYKYAGVTDERNAPAVDRQGRLDQLEALHISFLNMKRG
jgi:hypothetical protein